MFEPNQNAFPGGPSSSGSRAFPVGLLTGGVMIGVNLVLWLITQDMGAADFIGWFVGWFALFMGARSAAQQQYDQQQLDIEPCRGVQGAGVGAALVAVIVVMVFVIVRDLVVESDLFATMWAIIRVPVDIFLALGLGAWGARIQACRNTIPPFYP